MISDKVLRRRQQQANDLLAKQADELRRLELRHAEARSKLADLQASERDIVKVRHRRELAELYQGQGRELGAWARAQLERREVTRGS